MVKECVLYDGECKNCGECEICDMDSSKKCDNCGKCIGDTSEYRSINLEDFLIVNEDGDIQNENEEDGEI